MRRLHTGYGLNNLPLAERASYGDTLAAQLKEVALALCPMWVNRLLFLKLLDGQLVRYHAPEHAGPVPLPAPGLTHRLRRSAHLFSKGLNRAPAGCSSDVMAAITALVTSILAAKTADPAANIRVVDAAVTALYKAALPRPTVETLLVG